MLGVLTQKSSLEFPFTAREVVAMGRMPFGVSEGFDEVTEELLSMFGVAADQSFLTMSGVSSSWSSFVVYLRRYGAAALTPFSCSMSP